MIPFGLAQSSVAGGGCAGMQKWLRLLWRVTAGKKQKFQDWAKKGLENRFSWPPAR
jgi:hypothetical protein